MHLLFASLCSLSGAVNTPLFAAGVSFEKDIRPILEAKCVKCHVPEEQKNGEESKFPAVTQ